MACALIGKSIDQCMRTPIEWKQEKSKLLIITIIVIALIGAAFAGYYTAGSSLDWFGTAEGGAYACWALSGAIVLGTAASYIARSIISKKNPYSPPDVKV